VHSGRKHKLSKQGRNPMEAQQLSSIGFFLMLLLMLVCCE